MIVDLLKYIIPWLFGLLKDRTPEGFAAALELIGPIVEEMFARGGGRLGVGFRAQYELRMIRVLDAAGLLEEA
jgi:hypothetical protein